MLKAYVLKSLLVHIKKRLKCIKICLQISCRQHTGRGQIAFTWCVSQVPTLYCPWTFIHSPICFEK
jgi:hypothetical protein